MKRIQEVRRMQHLCIEWLVERRKNPFGSTALTDPITGIVEEYTSVQVCYTAKGSSQS